MILLPLTNLGNGRFILKYKDTYLQLFEELEKWIRLNAKMSEKNYKEYAEVKLDVKRKIFEENISTIRIDSIDSIKNSIFDHNSSSTSTEYILINDSKNYQNSDIGFASSKFPKENSGQTILLRDKCRAGTSLAEITSKYIFTGDETGVLKQWSISEQILVKDYGQIHKRGLQSMAVTSDGKFLFTSDCLGSLKQFSICEKILVKQFVKAHEGSIRSMSATIDCEYLFTSDEFGSLIQWAIQDPCVVVKKDWGQVQLYQINSVITTFDSQFIFTSDCVGNLKKWSIRKQKLVKDFETAHSGSIESMSLSFSEDL